MVRELRQERCLEDQIAGLLAADQAIEQADYGYVGDRRSIARAKID